jgi:GAF domain-containing protein
LLPLQDEKARQRAAEEDRRAEEARRARVDSSSAAIVRRLQRKRFSQVFAFLDRSAAGLIDLAALLEDPPAYLEELDDDVGGSFFWGGPAGGWRAGAPAPEGCAARGAREVRSAGFESLALLRVSAHPPSLPPTPNRCVMTWSTPRASLCATRCPPTRPAS